MLRTATKLNSLLPPSYKYISSTQICSYATADKKPGRPSTDSDTVDLANQMHYFEQAVKDYLRPTVRPKVKKTPLEYKQNAATNFTSGSIFSKTYTKLKVEYDKKKKMMKAAYEALPPELQKEAGKADWVPFPGVFVLPFHLPSQAGFELPNFGSEE